MARGNVTDFDYTPVGAVSRRAAERENGVKRFTEVGCEGMMFQGRSLRLPTGPRIHVSSEDAQRDVAQTASGRPPSDLLIHSRPMFG